MRRDRANVKPIEPDDAICRLRTVGQPVEDAWLEECEFWAPEEPSLIMFFGDCAHVAVAHLHGPDPTADRIFELMEFLCRKGNPQVQEAVVTGFLEALPDSPPAADAAWFDKTGPALRAELALGWAIRKNPPYL